MQIPVPVADSWRTLLVVAYCTGLRKSDLFRLRFEDVDPEARTLFVRVQKTGKPDVLPLHDAALEHVERIRSDRDLVIECGAMADNGTSSTRWREIVERACVDHFTLHDVRRTAASEIDRIQPGLGAVLLQHAPTSITARLDLDKSDELREAVDAMRLPLAFRHGPKHSDLQERRGRDEAPQAIARSDYRRPQGPTSFVWSFVGGNRSMRSRSMAGGSPRTGRSWSRSANSPAGRSTSRDSSVCCRGQGSTLQRPHPRPRRTDASRSLRPSRGRRPRVASLGRRIAPPELPTPRRPATVRRTVCHWRESGAT